MAQLHFQTNVQLKSIIGKDLINDDNLAILELVKNSYDANSPEAIIIFKNIKNNDDGELSENKVAHKNNIPSYTKNTSQIIIQDFGIGMNETDIKEKWLNIAYSEKKVEKKKYNRILAGNKGVGRFSCDRLGEYLNVYSRRSNSKIVHIFVDWKQFEIESKNKVIQDVDIFYDEIDPSEFEKRTGYKIFDSGTILEITKLRSKWTAYDKSKNLWSKEKLVGLKKQLERLINPNQAYTDNEFKIFLEAPEFLAEDEVASSNEIINGEVRSKVFEELNFKTTSVVSEIDPGGKTITTTLQDKGKVIFKLVEKNMKFHLLKNVKIFIYFLNAYSKAYFTKQTGIRSVDFGSIYLFLNGFRIPPYGDAGDDWLKIEIRKGQGYNRFFSTRDIVGRIEILDENDNFQIISSRAGIKENENYHQLTDREGYFFRTFRKLERYVTEGIDWDSIPEYLKNKIPEIEAQILEGKWSIEDEIFDEDDASKSRRVYSLIHSIINAKQEDVESLYVNENLILQKVAEDRVNAEKDFSKLLDDFTKKKINVDVVNKVLLKKAQLDSSLLRQINEFSKYPTDEATTKAILEIEALREENKKQVEQIKLLVEENKKLRAETENAQSSSESKDKIILFHKKLLSKEAEELIEFHHAIGISADTIEKHLINLRNDLVKGNKVSNEELFEFIDDISYESKKIISITNFATAAQFSADADEISADLIETVRQYANEVSSGLLRTYDGTKKIKISVDSKTNDEFICQFKPLEIAIILDNLFSNARKARATSINVFFNKISDKILEIHIRDNGRGVDSKIKNEIFNFGFTTTNGSGLGLPHTKRLMKKYNGDVLLNEKNKIGAEFILVFHI